MSKMFHSSSPEQNGFVFLVVESSQIASILQLRDVHIDYDRTE
jgi:hypothetical protein